MSVRLHSRHWSPEELLKDISHTDYIAASPEEHEERYANLWQGLCSESDAAALKHEIHRRAFS